MFRFAIGWLVVAITLMIAGCAQNVSTVENVWIDDKNSYEGIRQALVVALVPRQEIAVVIEDEWVSQLTERGVRAAAVHKQVTDSSVIDEQELVRLVRRGGYDSVLLTRLVKAIQVEREVPSSQTALLEVSVYSAGSEHKYWSARAHVYMPSPRGGLQTTYRKERAQEFVGSVIEHMASAGLVAKK